MTPSQNNNPLNSSKHQEFLAGSQFGAMNQNATSQTPLAQNQQQQLPTQKPQTILNPLPDSLIISSQPQNPPNINSARNSNSQNTPFSSGLAGFQTNPNVNLNVTANSQYSRTQPPTDLQIPIPNSLPKAQLNTPNTGVGNNVPGQQNFNPTPGQNADRSAASNSMSMDSGPSEISQTIPKYINPNNIQIPKTPKNFNELKAQAIEAQKPLPEDANLYAQEYRNLINKQNQIQINTFDILKLCLYVVPVLALFVLLLKYTGDDEVLWHSRQSAVAQTLWIVVLYIINSTNAPLIAGGGLTVATLWNVLCIGMLIYAGSQAYMGKKYRIPLISEIGSGFIDSKDNSR